MINFNFIQITIYVFFFTFVLCLINYFMSKFKFCLDFKNDLNEKHKQLLNKDKIPVPLSGSLYFLTIFFISIFFFNLEYKLFLFLFIFLIIGFFADLNFLVSPKVRIVIQMCFTIFFVYMDQSLNVHTRIPILDYLLNDNLFRIFFITFLLLTLINGYNFIDGTNLLASLNFLIVSFFLLLLSIKILDNNLENFFIFFIFSLLVFIFFNFFGKNFLGDSGSYGIAAFIGFFTINEIAQVNFISPYFVINLLFYPAFENFFTIVRRFFLKSKKLSPDNGHLHHFLYRYFLIMNKKLKKNYVVSSMVGIVINLYLFFSIYVAYNFISYTKYQIYIIFFNIFFYLGVYFFLKKKIDD